MNRKRLYIITDDAPWACLVVFGIGLYGLPDWATIVDTAEGIAAIPAGVFHRACWHLETPNSRYMQRLVVERWAARELITAPQAFMDRIEEMIAERDRKPDAPAADGADAIAFRHGEPVIAEEAHEQPKRKASKWH